MRGQELPADDNDCLLAISLGEFRVSAPDWWTRPGVGPSKPFEPTSGGLAYSRITLARGSL